MFFLVCTFVKPTNSITSEVSFACVARLTDTDHGSQWQVIIDSAYGMVSTWLDSQTGVFTVSIETSLLARTVSISFTRIVLFNGLGN